MNITFDKRKALHGIIPPLITPLLDTDKLDVRGLEKLVEHVLEGCVHGIFILGTTGEAPSLSYRLRQEVIERTLRLVNNRVPVLVGVSDTCITESVNLANKAADEGAAAVVSTTPFYFSPNNEELINFFKILADRLPLPLYMYNLPAFTKIMMNPDVVLACAAHKNIIGIKDSSGMMSNFRLMQYAVKDIPEFEIFVGLEEILAEGILLGANGGVSGGANMFPKLYVDLYNACVEKEFKKILVLQNKVLQISSTIYKVGSFFRGYLNGIKCTLSIMGICDDFLAEPFHRFSNEEREQIKRLLSETNNEVESY